jgi:ABC-type multidrug transport system ATPase subunit
MEIEIKGLNKIYPNGKQALNDINLSIESGMFGLLGPNGAGKSTLMRILTTLLTYNSGQVTIDGMDLSKDRGKIRSMLGYLPQDFRFFSKLKTHEFLDYAARLGGVKGRKHRATLVDEMLERVGLYEARDRNANDLSGGMKRRLGIAQALIHDPQVLIVDEPTTGLDPEERIRFRNILSDLSQKDVIIILSTHIVGDISSVCNDLALINHGTVAFKGAPEEFIKLSENHVWKMNVSEEEYQQIKDQYSVIATIPQGKGWEIQVVGDSLNSWKGEVIQPNLEHAYVYFTEHKLND